MNVVAKLMKVIVGLAAIVGLITGAVFLWEKFGPEGNQKPLITSFRLERMQVSPGGEIKVQAEAYDEDGDLVKYVWEATGGGYIVTDGQPNRARYTAPAQVGHYLVKLKVQDGNGGDDEEKLPIEVKEKDPKVVEAEARAFRSYEARDWTNAIVYFSSALERDPSLYTPWIFRGNAYLENGQYQLAVADFTKALELFPENDNVYLLRSKAFLLSDQQQQAVFDVDQFLSGAEDETTEKLLQDFHRLDIDDQLLRLDYTVQSMPSLLSIVSVPPID